MQKQIYDAIILGAGPSGLSTALDLARVKLTALVATAMVRVKQVAVNVQHERLPSPPT